MEVVRLSMLMVSRMCDGQSGGPSFSCSHRSSSVFVPPLSISSCSFLSFLVPSTCVPSTFVRATTALAGVGWAFVLGAGRWVSKVEDAVGSGGMADAPRCKDGDGESIDGGRTEIGTGGKCWLGMCAGSDVGLNTGGVSAGSAAGVTEYDGAVDTAVFPGVLQLDVVWVVQTGY